MRAPPDLSRWPLDTTAIALSRAVGILTNALVILGVAFFIGGLASTNQKRILVWAAIAPVTLINVDYVWPKLFATFFLFLALGAVVRSKPMWLCALPCVAAYLSHPIGALFTPPVLLYLGLLRASPAALSQRWIVSMISTGVKFSALWFCFALPWLIFKWQLDQPDVFTRYPLGDGNGLESAASLSSWLMTRFYNIWYTFVPSAFFFSDHMKEWFGTPLSDSLRWGITYAKSMPGNIGILTYLAGVAMLSRRSPLLPYYRPALLFTSALLILIFWGFSGDGLGRNCLEPLSLLFLLWISQRANPEGRIWDALVAVTAFEALSVRLIGILGQPTFSLQTITIEPALLLIFSTAATLAPLLLLMKKPSH
ncbi:MAG TPA: hypothetical protein PLN52_21325, partial [Opitutaceae bacterium]|nr:hypothetical protein [Opitutaceae bacterium]